MDMTLVRDEIGDVLDTIPGLRVYRHQTESIVPPAAVIWFRSGDYDQSFQRGLDRWQGVVTVAVSAVFDRNASIALADLIAGHSPTSIHAVLRAREQAKEWVNCSFARAVRWDVPTDGIIVNGIPYMGAEIDLDIAGPGT